MILIPPNFIFSTYIVTYEVNNFVVFCLTNNLVLVDIYLSKMLLVIISLKLLIFTRVITLENKKSFNDFIFLLIITSLF